MGERENDQPLCDLALATGGTRANIISRRFPVEQRARAINASLTRHLFDVVIPTCRKHARCAGVPDHVEGYAEPGHNGFGRQRVNNLMDGFFAHTPHNAKLFSNRQANSSALRQLCWHGIMQGMDSKKETPRPFADIAERLKWHRDTVGMKQEDYAKSIGAKRSALSLWEAGTHRLSLNAALDLRNKYGLSLDFMYEGIDDALPMTLRNAWRDRP